MAFITAALITGGSAILGGGLSYLGGREQAGAASDAANLQYNASMAGIDLQRRMYEENVKRMQPYIDVGTSNLSSLSDIMKSGTFSGSPFSFNMSGWQTDPGYQFRLDQGRKAIENSAAARGGYFSGQLGAALSDYGQGTASSEYSNVYNRNYQAAFNEWLANNQQKTDLFNKYAALAGIGQTTGTNIGNAGMNTAGSISNALSGMASGVGAANMAGANATANMYTGIGNALTSGIGTYMNYQNQKSLLDAINGMNNQSVYAPGSQLYPAVKPSPIEEMYGAT